MSLRATIARNTIFNGIGRAWDLLTGLFLTWYIVRHTGLAGLGLWSLVMAFTGYAALFDLGLASGFSRHIAAHHARDDRHALSAVLSTGFFFYLVTGFLILAATWWSLPALVAYVVADAASWPEVLGLLRGALLLLVAQQALAPFVAVPIGLQRMGLANVIGWAVSLVKVVATVGLLHAGYGVTGLLYAQGAVIAAQYLLAVPAAFLIAPGLRLDPRTLGMPVFRELFSFGWRSQIARMANLVNFQTDRVVLAWVYRDVALVGAYRLGEDLSSKLRQAPALLVTALVPAAADLDARDQQDTLQHLCIVSTKYMAAVAFPLTAFTIAAADPLMRAWMGQQEGLGTAAWVLRLLALGYLANLLAGPAMSVALGRGRADLAMQAGIVSTVANIVLTIALVFPAGIYGVAAATSLGMLISTAWFFARLHSALGVQPAALLREALLWPALASVPGLLWCLGIAYGTRDWAGHGANFGAAMAAALGLALLYLGVLRVAPFLNAFDHRFLEETLRLGRLPGYRWLVGSARHA